LHGFRQRLYLRVGRGGVHRLHVRDDRIKVLALGLRGVQLGAEGGKFATTLGYRLTPTKSENRSQLANQAALAPQIIPLCLRLLCAFIRGIPLRRHVFQFGVDRLLCRVHHPRPPLPHFRLEFVPWNAFGLVRSEVGQPRLFCCFHAQFLQGFGVYHDAAPTLIKWPIFHLTVN